ncbi:2-amino-4-hydroxy-6-hydroxymethyldihydropteridine diphosphokinase [Ahrensia sp. AH-315-G08]|nr:2-amino-4-hydroxy-6-hydroxymethyldihydropteridine diphosphokinase [Ahrensia sp. AH-315-G08]
MKRAWLGLGGNVGDVREAMARALLWMDGQSGLTVTDVSPIYKTPPWGVEDQPWFLNCCAQIKTNLSPEELLETCREAERRGKRKRIIRWGPRTIDVDILMMEGVEQVEQRLTIPHPRIEERAFVLVPFADIAAEEVLNGRSVAEWAAAINKDGLERLETDANWWRLSR